MKFAQPCCRPYLIEHGCPGVDVPTFTSYLLLALCDYNRYVYFLMKGV